MKQQELLPHLFRTEYSKIVAVLCRHFGFDFIEQAQDIASDTFLAAMETWPFKGIPENAVSWLYTVAKNKALNHINRDKFFADKVAKELNYKTTEEQEIDMSGKNITDSQLQMLFAVCNPLITQEAQISLALRILCGFGIDEIATAFLNNKETINKRLYRVKEKLRQANVQMVFPSEREINHRLEAVLATLYLLFSEGYYSETQDEVMRKDLCVEAMRLTALLMQNPQTNLPAVNALFALMCFHTSRFDARKNERGEVVLYYDQDETRWNYELIAKGAYYLKEAAQGDSISKYHLEASIAYWHTIKDDSQEKWQHILKLYNQLLEVAYSPIAALNSIYAVSKVKGKKAAIAEAEKLQLADNHFYFILLGELYTDIDDAVARKYLHKALKLAKTKSDKQIIQFKIDQFPAV
ncbi:RNA polymerase sigma factor [Chondrinema litorale]|uniref:RNA polymerase sigma factor n=1 Tax=Chondrinema litorale TaxID=2994555 RepID=UPI00254281D6|nr:DUF6596 domain-containing protein [Chondrinema litorale]UZR95681.1 RNA polymerase subunit sigma [Chondrinema litorale]